LSQKRIIEKLIYLKVKNNKKIVGKKEVNFWRLATKEKMDILRKFGHQGKNGYFNKI